MKNKLKFLLIQLTFLICIANLRAQSNEKSFDFWIGNWDVYWNDSLKGSNDIIKILNNRIIQENFSTMDNSFTGMSWTVFDSINNLWKQTWVDNSGAYIIFTGGEEADGVVLYTEEKTKKNGEKYYLRMKFENINRSEFDWNWQSSPDKKYWKTVWAIKYKRKV